MRLLLLLLLTLTPSCWLLPPTHSMAEPVEFELGAQDFPGGDAILIERVLGDYGALVPGTTVVVEGTYELNSRDRGVLYLGVTNSGADGATAIEPGQQLEVERGAGAFALWITMPDQGWPHLTFYDPEAGGPFGGVYFGVGESVLHEKQWRYNPPPPK
ncbi:MAG: hypothetical protein P1V81_15720 [Planctomycetota bacterium]|nr:hypothetical protein [Planctomycetota bacterium]